MLGCAEGRAPPREPRALFNSWQPDATGQRFRQRYPLLLGPRFRWDPGWALVHNQPVRDGQSTVNAILKETLNGTRTFLSQHVSSIAPSSSRRLAVQHEQAE